MKRGLYGSLSFVHFSFFWYTSSRLQNIKLKNVDQEIKQEFEKMDERFDVLTQIIKSGFDSIDERFNVVDQRFEAVDKRFEKIENRLDSIESRLVEIQRDIQSLRHQLEGLEKRTKEDTDALANDVVEFCKRLDVLEKQAKQLQASQ
ncbi:hypothetical protein A2316_01815 [Candidatus Falkowbacteria bacterium RIFOXYB2_FULL_38_15]|uniref:t-SNARE coiled-coil homology domain-containing protein n=1 Tax=Candidatus Falkowbacteria bacterium RIFOXYA2_FULL_38_12 TaxID=1797993 RepID=A0A1F5S318_9BACT|nr:MAG: hypothetical protein A2257_03595 [Candidatus Falkowbacteria bacterium RIFOXYA2_FULL_38_12]OGF32688.1 MAG: hypothetical protein A2316_01815 [Candidatus Falkowbacteria bacterium RIFOXYB2_FULL_38_15]OGF42092.1 MAG: hypothetical protein A2555_01710 [Candidatus Falkowbacteria bacterium RIFOXYD2_FULL_39_16]